MVYSRSLLSFPSYRSLLPRNSTVPPYDTPLSPSRSKVSFGKSYGVKLSPKIVFNYCTPILVWSPQICTLCFTNSKSNDHLFIQCPFTWQLWGELFHLINLIDLFLTLSLHSSLNEGLFHSLGNLKSFETYAFIPYYDPFGNRRTGESLKMYKGI